VSGLVWLDLGRMPYDGAMDVQDRLVAQVATSSADVAYLLLVEHDPPVVTLGKSSRPEHLRVSPRELIARGIQVRRSDRGGSVTLHARGQVVGYPIVNLRRLRMNVRKYLFCLEQAVLRLLVDLGVVAYRAEGLTGIWTCGGKVAAIGVAVRAGIACHGFALNVSPDLSLFKTIVPCGITDKPVTSIERVLGRGPSIAAILGPLAECTAEALGFASVRRGKLQRVLGGSA